MKIKKKIIQSICLSQNLFDEAFVQSEEAHHLFGVKPIIPSKAHGPDCSIQPQILSMLNPQLSAFQQKKPPQRGSNFRRK